MKEPLVLVGMVVSVELQKKIGVIRFIPPPGSIEVECHLCGNKMFLGPKLQEKAEECPDAIIGCMVCVIRMKPKGHEISNAGGTSGTYFTVFGNRIPGDPTKQ